MKKYSNWQKKSDSIALFDVEHLEDSGSISAENLASRVRSGLNPEQSACDIHYLIILNKSIKAKAQMETLMTDESLPLPSLDYCFRYYHFAFREQIGLELTKSALNFLESLLYFENFDIRDKAAFSIGEFYLYNPYDEVKKMAREIIENVEKYPDESKSALSYTRRRVGV